MQISVVIAAAGLLIGMIAGYSSVMRAIGRLELKVDLLWAWYIGRHPELLVGGRRHDDPPKFDSS